MKAFKVAKGFHKNFKDGRQKKYQRLVLSERAIKEREPASPIKLLRALQTPIKTLEAKLKTIKVAKAKKVGQNENH